jgi:hypothetical protein
MSPVRTERHLQEVLDAVRTLRRINRAAGLDRQMVEELGAAIERGAEAALVETTGVARLPVMTLAQLSAAAVRDRKARLSLVEGGAQ